VAPATRHQATQIPGVTRLQNAPQIVVLRAVQIRPQSTRHVAFQRHQDFLTLWKDADRGIPILTRAQAEYSRLQ
jgi:hypothetical protein